MQKHRKLYLKKAKKLLKDVKQHKQKEISKNCNLANIIAGFYLLIGRMKKVE